MADFYEFYPLRSHNTFGFDARARLAAHIRSESDLVSALSDPRAAELPVVVLGGGSNVVLTGDLDACVLLMEIPGYEIADDGDTGDHWLVTAGAGENWHALVSRTVADGLPGLENLSLIPGTAGAAPIQNIGAYGVELRDRFARLRALDRQTGEFVTLDLDACAFDYRDSLFKRDPDHYVVTAVEFALTRTPMLTLDYAGIGEELQAMGIESPRASHVAEAVIRIRQRKLPDPDVLGNAGSFCKN